MKRNLIIVSSHPTLYGSADGLLPDAASKIDRFIYEKDITEESLSGIIDYIDSHGIEGVISRGPWAPVLENHLEIPVFPFTVDTFDILCNIDQAAQKGFKNIGLFSWLGNQNNPYSYGTLYTIQLGDIHVYMTHIKTPEEAHFLMERMIEGYGMDAAIGDIEFTQMVEEAGYPYFPYRLSSDYLAQTIEYAAHSVKMQIQKKKNHSYVTAITNIIGEASIITDGDGKILFSNKNAEDDFNIRYRRISNITDILPVENTGTEIVNRYIRLGQNRYVLNVLPLSLNEEPCFSYLLSNARSIEKTEITIRKQQHKTGLSAKYHFEDIIYADPLMETIIKRAKRFASSDGTVLITGESGTGKEVFANSIHNASQRSDGPFVAINCATLSESLIESELFGYEKGAFTGALSSGKKGLFELADKGTLFLDEIGELSISTQAKLLRVLQEQEVRHVGGDKNIPVNVRILAATNKPLLQMVSDGTFREDLYYRLSLLELRLPPLRSRSADIIPLFQNFVLSLGEKSGLKIYWTDDSVFEPLLTYSWPGNIRELRNIAERAVLLSDSLSLTKDYLKELVPIPNLFEPEAPSVKLQMRAAMPQPHSYPFYAPAPPVGDPATGAAFADPSAGSAFAVPSAGAAFAAPSAGAAFAVPSAGAAFSASSAGAAPFAGSEAEDTFTTEGMPDLEALESQYIRYLLEHFDGDKSKVCSHLGISKPTLWRKLNEKGKEKS